MSTVADKTPLISSYIVVHIIKRLREQNVKARPILKEFGLVEDELIKNHTFIPLKVHIDLLEFVSIQLNDPLLGFNISKKNGPATIGALGFMFLSAKNLKLALQSLQKFTRTVQQATEANIVNHRLGHLLTYKILDESIFPRRQDSEYSVVFMHELIRLYTNNEFRAEEVYFEHEELTTSNTLKKYFGCPVKYSQHTNGVVFDKSYLSYKSHTYDSALFPILKEYITQQSLVKFTAPTFKNRVYNAISKQDFNEPISLASISAILGVSSPSLQRYLKAENTSFREIINSYRFSKAKRLLEASSISITEISFHLGFSDNTAFSRAFQRWANTSPRDYRYNSRNTNLNS